VVIAAQRGLRRGVVEQFRRPAVLAAGRGWVIDSILITGSVAGLIEVLSLQQAGATQQGALILLVPGLVGPPVAVVASRLLPLGCRALYGLASRCRALAAYLALRHIARRSGGVRTTVVLATAFSMAAFAFAAWSVGQRNYQLVAQTQVGAADVLTVEVPAGQNLGAIVDKADPSGRLATAVDACDGTLAVDPARFARIAYWPRHLPPPSVAELEPPAPPIVLSGDALRVTVDVGSMPIAHGQLSANMTGGTSPIPSPARRSANSGTAAAVALTSRTMVRRFPGRDRCGTLVHTTPEALRHARRGDPRHDLLMLLVLDRQRLHHHRDLFLPSPSGHTHARMPPGASPGTRNSDRRAQGSSARPVKVKAPAPDLHAGSRPKEVPASAGSHNPTHTAALRHPAKTAEPTPTPRSQPHDNGNQPQFSPRATSPKRTP
jgi:hypothetical protein